MSTDTKAALKTLLSERSLIFGKVILSNGSESNHYFDCKRTTLHATGAWLIGDAVLRVIREKLQEWPVAVGGLNIGADPIIGSVMMRAHECGLSLDGFYVRQKAKQHGTKNLIENAPAPGSGVVIVEDVVTRGGSVLQAVDAAIAAGCRILAVITVIDRLEGGTEKVKEKVDSYFPLFTLDDFRSEIDQYPTEAAKSELQSTET